MDFLRCKIQMLFNDRQQGDVSFRCGQKGREIFAHRAVLACWSNIFRDIFKPVLPCRIHCQDPHLAFQSALNPQNAEPTAAAEEEISSIISSARCAMCTQRIVIMIDASDDDQTAQIFDDFIAFFYSGAVSLDGCNIEKMRSLALIYEVKELQRLCDNFLAGGGGNSAESALHSAGGEAHQASEEMEEEKTSSKPFDKQSFVAKSADATSKNLSSSTATAASLTGRALRKRKVPARYCSEEVQIYRDDWQFGEKKERKGNKRNKRNEDLSKSKMSTVVVSVERKDRDEVVLPIRRGNPRRCKAEPKGGGTTASLMALSSSAAATSSSASDSEEEEEEEDPPKPPVRSVSLEAESNSNTEDPMDCMGEANGQCMDSSTEDEVGVEGGRRRKDSKVRGLLLEEEEEEEAQEEEEGGGGGGSPSEGLLHPKGDTCHHCKVRKRRWVACPLKPAHRFCFKCVPRHFEMSFKEMQSKVEHVWRDGCPACLVTCPCAGCERKRERSGRRGWTNARERHKKKATTIMHGDGNSDEEVGRKKEAAQQHKEEEDEEDEDEASARDEKKATGSGGGGAPKQHVGMMKKRKSEDEEREEQKRSRTSSAVLQRRARPLQKRPKRTTTTTTTSSSSSSSSRAYVVAKSNEPEAFLGLLRAGNALTMRYTQKKKMKKTKMKTSSSSSSTMATTH